MFALAPPGEDLLEIWHIPEGVVNADYDGPTHVHLRGATRVHLGRTTVMDFGHLGGSRPLEEVLEGPARHGETAAYFSWREALRR
jgi:hypothetical protein